MTREEKAVRKLLHKAGIKINGSSKWDIQVNNPKFYSKLISGGSLAFGEMYVAGWWDCKDIRELINKLMRADLDAEVRTLSMALSYLKAKVVNNQTRSKSLVVGKQHYDVGNDLYKLMLDKRMVYTCAYWYKAKSLDLAQEHKLDLVCKKLDLKKGQKILDIGCGWGSFAKFAAKKYGVKVVGITISKEQAKLARENCKGLPVEIRLQDYRDVKEKFDHIVSLGMFEHVGAKNYNTYFKKARALLKDNGKFLLHTIGNSYSRQGVDPWIDKYIFPGAEIPSFKNTTNAIADKFIVEDLHNFGPDYHDTLMAWYANFKKSWPKIKNNYNDRFYRMWGYYLLSCAGSFKARRNQLWQFVLAKSPDHKTYRRVS